MSLLVWIILVVGMVAGQLPWCQDKATVTRGLAEFLRLQHAWRTCVQHNDASLRNYYRTEEMDGDWPRRMDNQAYDWMLDFFVQRELCREHLVDSWTGPECRADLAANGTILGPRDVIHVLLAPYLGLRPRIEWNENPCGGKTYQTMMRYFGNIWFSVENNDQPRCTDGTIVPNELGWVGQCVRCVGPTVTPRVMLN